MKMNFVKPPSSPLAAFGLNKELQPTAPEYWNYERLSNLTPDQIISSLKIVSNLKTTLLLKFFLNELLVLDS